MVNGLFQFYYEYHNSRSNGSDQNETSHRRKPKPNNGITTILVEAGKIYLKGTQ